MLFFYGLDDALRSAMLPSMTRVFLLYFVMPYLGLFLVLPKHSLAATENYNDPSFFSDLIGNAPSYVDPSDVGSVASVGGTDDLVSHGDNVYSYGNIVNVNGGEVVNRIFGGYYNRIASGVSVSSNDNAVTIGSAFAGNTNLNIYGGYASSIAPWSMTASDNTVTINGGTARNVLGGFAFVNSGTGSAIATASGNVVNINGGTTTIDSIYGGYVFAKPVGGTSTAYGNTVNISGGNANNVYGGYAVADNVGGTATAYGNTVNISGGSVGSVYGGSVGVFADTGQATNNVVTISGSPNLTASSLYGGFSATGSSVESFSGNTLNVKTTGLTVKDVYNFQYLNFYLPSTVSAGDTVLTVTGTADLTGSSGRSSTVNVGIDGSSSPLQAGDIITLIDAGTLVTNSGLNSSASGTGMQGVTLKYNFDLTTESNKLLATVSAGTAPAVNEQSKALSEGFVSGMGAVMQGADVAAAQGMDSAVAAAKAGGAGGGGAPVGFGALSGGSVRHNTGSHVDMHSVSLMAGLSWGADTPSGRLTVGPFVEYGYGSYSTYNSFSNAASVEGDGNTRYLGGGILGRMDLANTGPGHIYVEASGRGGGLYNEYKSSDLRDAAGRSAEYDSSSKYYGLHMGTGYVWNITEDASLDLYAKYFWTRQEGDSVTLSTGDPIDFKDVDSSRLRLGSRVSYMVNEYLSPYIGAAYEREFDGTARASTNGYAMKAPSMGGDTGTGELGLVYTPSASVPVSFDLGVQNSVGKREGLTGSLQFKYEF